MRSIKIFCPYPFNQAPSQRFRFEQYLTLLKEAGFKVTFLSFYNQSDWESLYVKGNFIQKFVRLSIAVFAQIVNCIVTLKDDYILIHRELLPIGPPVLEWVIAKILRKKIIYDFDDAIWLTDKINESKIGKKIRWRSKVSSICKWSYKVSCGNKYLCIYAQQFNQNVILNPTTIDTKQLHNSDLYKIPIQKKAINQDVIIIGWTGSHSTLKYLKSIESVLVQLENQFQQIQFLVIADQPPDLMVTRLKFIRWNKETEVTDLIKMDIGIMPLPDDEWAKGKCGFKALQYMALEIPCIASPVGVNTTIIQQGINGFLCNTSQEWIRCFELLISNEQLRKQIGKAGRITVEENYSVRSNASNFLSLFE